MAAGVCLRRYDNHGQAMDQAKAVATSPPAGDSIVRCTTERIELLIASSFRNGKPHSFRFADGERFHQDQWSRSLWSLVLGPDRTGGWHRAVLGPATYSSGSGV